MKLRNSKLKMISILMIIIMLMNFNMPLTSNAFFMSILTKPICSLGVHALDAVNSLASVLNLGETEYKNLVKGLDNDNIKDDDEHTTATEKIQKMQDNYYNSLMSPDKIFGNKVKLLNANIFNAEINEDESITTQVSNNIDKGIGSELGGVLKKSVASIYVVLRNICAVVLLCLLIYTGIKILITSASPYKQAEWKRVLLDWVKALCLLVFMHYIMIGIFYISDLLVESLSKVWGELSIVALIRYAFKNQSFLDSSACIIYLLMYAYITYLTIAFFISYFKRLIWVIVLIAISPVVATTYALGQSGQQIFKKWFKEYLMTVLIQPFHMLIFYILVILPLGIASGGGTFTTGISDNVVNALFGSNYSTPAMQLYVIISIAMIRPAEKFLMGLFGFSESSIAKQASSDTGVKAIGKAVKTAVDIGMLATGAGAAMKLGASQMMSAGATEGGELPLDDSLMVSNDTNEAMYDEDGYSDWYLNDNLTPEPMHMSEDELQQEMDNFREMGYDEDEIAELESQYRANGHGNKGTGANIKEPFEPVEGIPDHKTPNGLNSGENNQDLLTAAQALTQSAEELSEAAQNLRSRWKCI